MKFQTILLILFTSVMVNIGFSQTQSMHNVYFNLPEIALLDIEPNTNDIILEFDAPAEPGNELTPIAGDTKWINYTATLALAGTPKIITAQIASSTNIPGLNIELVVSSYNGNGKGVLGTSVGSINLSTTAQTIISGIGGCFTRSGANKGHEVEYNATISDYSIFEVPTTPNMEIIYTIGN